MAGVGAIAVIIRGTNGNGAAVSRKGDAVSGGIEISFSIDVSAGLLPGIGCAVALIDARMARISAIAIVKVSADSNNVAVSRKGDAPSGVIATGFSIDVSAD